MVTINYRDGRPIYEQVKDDLRRLVVTGAMQPGEKLPSVRELAVSLAINPNTIQRAYHELESEGYIVSVPGKGSFCAQFSLVSVVSTSSMRRVSSGLLATRLATVSKRGSVTHSGCPSALAVSAKSFWFATAM